MKNIKKRKALLLAIFLALILTSCKNDSTKSITTVGVPTEDKREANAEYIRKGLHTNETIYAGENLSPKLFSYQFERTEKYRSNKEIVEDGTLDDELYNKFKQTASEYTKLLFGSNSYDLVSDQDGFIESYSKFFDADNVYIDGDEEVSIERQARDVISWYVDNDIYAEEQFETSKCLVYEDYYAYFLRAAVHVTVNSDSATKAFKERYGIDVKNNTPFTMICEFEFTDNRPDLIRGFYILSAESK